MKMQEAEKICDRWYWWVEGDVEGEYQIWYRLTGVPDELCFRTDSELKARILVELLQRSCDLDDFETPPTRKKEGVHDGT